MSVAVPQQDMTRPLLDFWSNYVEGPIYKVGLGHPLRRFAVVTAATGMILYALKPKTMYDSEGRPFPSALLEAMQDRPTKNGKVLNWVGFSIMTGVFSLLFI